MAEAPSPIIDVTLATFERDIVQRSLEQPVIVDFWAPWCAPCRQLAPALEAIAREHAGKVTLAKVNVDEQPEIAQAFGVQSIPFVVAMRDGRPVDQFMGLLPDEELRAWFTALLPSPAEQLFRRGLELQESSPAEAEAAYREALSLTPENDRIRIALLELLTRLQRDDEARRIIEELEKRGFLEPEAERMKAELDLRAVAAEAGDVQAARAAAAANPDDLALQLTLAEALIGVRKYEEALEVCLQIIQRDRDGVGQTAKDVMVKVFETLGSGSELVSNYRRKLATALY